MITFHFGIPHSVMATIEISKDSMVVWDQLADNLHHPIAWPLLKACRA